MHHKSMHTKFPNHEEIHALRDLVLLQLCIQTLEARLMRSHSPPDREHTQRIMDAATSDFVAIKKKLKAVGIEVLFDTVIETEYVLKFPFICRGSQDKFFALKDHYRAEIREKLKEYRG